MVAESSFDWSSLKMAAGQASYASAVGMHPPMERRPALRNSTALITQGTKDKRFSNIQRLQRGKAILYVAGLHRHIMKDPRHHRPHCAAAMHRSSPMCLRYCLISGPTVLSIAAASFVA